MTPSPFALKPKTDPLQIYRYRDGLAAVDLLTAAIVEFKFFDRLADKPASLSDICSQFGFKPRPADVLVTLARANGWLDTSPDGLHQTSQAAREHLTSDSPWNLTPYYASLRDRPLVHDYIRVLQSGEPAAWGGFRKGTDWHQAMLDPDFARSFTAAMDCRGALLGPALAQSIDLSKHHRLLDIGGGSGIYACACVDAYPELSATVFEQSPVDEVARQRIADLGFARRVNVLAGDMFNSLPHNYDVHLFSNVLHDWDEPDVHTLLNTSAKSLPPGGLLIIHDAFLNEDKSGPLPVAEYSALLMHTTRGRCYGTAELARWTTNVGLTPMGYRETRVDRGVFMAVKPIS